MVRDKREAFYLAGHHRILVCEELYKIRSFEIFPLRKVFDYFKTYNFIIFAKSIAKLLLINYVCQIGDCQVSYTFSVFLYLSLFRLYRGERHESLVS